MKDQSSKINNSLDESERLAVGDVLAGALHRLIALVEHVAVSAENLKILNSRQFS